MNTLWACQDTTPKSFTLKDQSVSSVMNDMDTLVAGEVAGVDAGTLAGEEAGAVAGEEAGAVAGEEAGAVAGEEAGTMAGEEAGAVAGEEAGVMIWNEEDAYGVPDYHQSTLLEVSGKIYLVWSIDHKLWVQIVNENGDAGSVSLLDEIEAPIDYIQGKVIQGVPWLVYGSDGKDVHLYTADAILSGYNKRSLPLHGPARLGQSAQSLLVMAESKQDKRKAWLRITENMPQSIPPIYAQDVWPLPDDLGLIAGQVVLRFDRDGQCMQMNQDLDIIFAYHCLYGTARFLQNDSISYLSYSSTQSDAAYVLLSHKPDLDIAYRFMQLWFDIDQNPQGLSYAHHSHRHVFTGIHRESDEGIPQERVIILEPDGMWVSVEGWQSFPYPNTRLITRKRNEAWAFVFQEDGLPQRESIALQDNTFIDTIPFFLNYSQQCRPQKEICDDLDNNCDGIVDNGICCMPNRDPLFATFIPQNKPLEFLVSDTEIRTTRFAVRVAEDEWEIWGFSYPQGGLEGSMRNYGSIMGAHDALGFIAVGEEDYSLMIAQNADGVWSVFWHLKDYLDPPKEVEPLGCDRPLAMDIIGAKPVNKSPVVICDDKIVHIIGKTLEEESFPEPVVYDQIFRDFPNLEWATITRHDFGSSSIVFAFQSLINIWQVKRASISFAGDVLNLVLPTDMSTELSLDETAVPLPLYLHTNKSPGVPGQFSTLEISSISDSNTTHRVEARAHVNQGDDQFIWSSIFMGGEIEHLDYNGLHSKLVGSSRLADDQVGFWVVDLRPNKNVDLWRKPAQFIWQSPRGAVGADDMQWHVTQGDYINYIFMMSQRADELWEMTLYSVLSCTPHIFY